MDRKYTGGFYEEECKQKIMYGRYIAPNTSNLMEHCLVLQLKRTKCVAVIYILQRNLFVYLRPVENGLEKFNKVSSSHSEKHKNFVPSSVLLLGSKYYLFTQMNEQEVSQLFRI